MSNLNNKNTRRDFLKSAAIGAGGISAMGTGMAFTNSSEDLYQTPKEIQVEKCDVAVVGAGVSGVYAALRLANTRLSPPVQMKSTPAISKLQAPRTGSPIEQYLKDNTLNRLKVRMFEYSGRVGGRLLSTPIPDIPVGDDNVSGPLQYAEFGGFRFDRQMKIVWETAEALGLEDEPFYYQDIKIEENNIVNVRGDIYTNANADDQNLSGPSFSDDSYKSYPNIRSDELKLILAGFDLGNHITNLAFESVLENATPRTPLNNYPNVAKIENITIPIEFQGNKVNYPAVKITFKKSFNPANPVPPYVVIPPGINGWSFSYVRYHYAFNAEDWATVKAVSDTYEDAKSKAKINGRPFYDWSWWALKRHYLSQEACAYLEDTSGYNEEGSAGTVETNIDENYYFSVKTDNPDTQGQLTYYSNSDQISAPTAWRHIRKGYSAIPKGIFDIYSQIQSTTGNNKFGPNHSKDIVKHQLVAFTKENSSTSGSASSPKYRCLFLKRQQGPAAAVTGSQALYDYQQAIITLNNPVNNPFTIKAKKEAAAVIAQYKIVYCNFLVLAIPRRALQMINQNNFFFGADGIQSLLHTSVHNIPAMRMFVAYPYPWWLEKPPYDNPNPAPGQSPYYPVGRTRTDLGLRQLYYWCYNKITGRPGVGAKKKNFADPNKPAVMLASYTSGIATLYWRSLQNGQPYDLISGSQTDQAHLYNPETGQSVTGHNIRNPQVGGPRHASLTMGLEAHKQIVELHGMAAKYSEIPLPYYVHFEDWTKDPWGAGWHSWKSSYAKRNYIPLIRNPLTDENVYIIGECYSNVQGWVQGALNSAESMLQCNFGLKWAPWLSINGIWLGQGTKWVTTSALDPDPDPCLEPTYFPRVINTRDY